MSIWSNFDLFPNAKLQQCSQALWNAAKGKDAAGSQIGFYFNSCLCHIPLADGIANAMLNKAELSVIASAFVLGLLAPILLSIVSVMISFRIGVAATTVLVPLSSVPGLDDMVVMGANGILYAGIALLIISLKRWRN